MRGELAGRSHPLDGVVGRSSSLPLRMPPGLSHVQARDFRFDDFQISA